MKGYEYIKENGITTNEEYYVDDLLAPLVNMGYKVKVFLVDYYIGWGTPNDYMTYMYWKEYFTPKLTVYDMDDTLVTYSRSNANAMKGVLAVIPAGVFAEAKKEIYEEFPESFVRHDKLVQIKRALSKLGRVNEALDIYTKYEEEYVEDIELLRIPNPKFKSVIMSNNNLKLQLKVASKLGIQVEEIFTSNEFVREKPDPDSLAYIASKYGVSPSEILVIGDSCTDVLWAHRGGARAFLI
jgi:HAD superfamily hydrolase (TIGR01549 family)